MPTAREQRAIRRDRLVRLATLMADPIGRGWMYDFLAACQVYGTCFATNALVMAHLEGQRDVGLRLLADLVEACPDDYVRMLKESDNVRPPSPRTDPDSSADASAESDPDA